MRHLHELFQFAAAHGGLVTRPQALEMNVAPAIQARLCSAGVLVRVHPGVYRVNGHPFSFASQARAAFLAVETNAWLSHRTAAALWKLLPEPGAVGVGDAPPIELVRPRKAYTDHAGLLIRRAALLHGDHVTELDGVPLTSPARTVLDLAQVFGSVRLERIMDDALRFTTCTSARLARLCDELRSRRHPWLGIAMPLIAARLEKPPTDSTLEDRMAELFEAAGLPTPQRRVELSDEQGRIGQVDFYFVEGALVLEADSEQWHGQRSDRRTDAARDRRLERSGRRVVRFTWLDVKDRPDSVVGTVRDLLAARVARVAA